MFVLIFFYLKNTLLKYLKFSISSNVVTEIIQWSRVEVFKAMFLHYHFP